MTTTIDVASIRRDFPILRTRIGGRPLVYLDNAATTQKPAAVLGALEKHYKESNANIHRGVHYLAERATDAYEMARESVARFLNAARSEEIIFVRGTTEGINLIARSYGLPFLEEGDEILLTTMEHHANIVPWQLVSESVGAKLRIIPVTESGELDMEAVASLLGERTKIVSLAHASNALGTINPVKALVDKAHACGAIVLLDGAQAVGHFPVDVQDLDCDFYVFSGHKLFSTTGSGVVYGKYELLERMPPFQGGGDMISKVTFEKTTYKQPPGRFEAGTPNIGGAVALGAAIDYFSGLDRLALMEYEDDLLQYATGLLSGIEGLRIYGRASEKVSLISFTLEGVHPHDIATVLDADGIAIRAGHHCTQPLHRHYGISATARASFAYYNTREEAEKLAASLEKIKQLFG